MERYLRTMRDDLVQLALRHGSPVLADHLKASIRQHGSAKLTAMTLRMVEQASTSPRRCRFLRTRCTYGSGH